MTEPPRAIIVIPAYQPTRALVELVATLSADGRPIVVIDDGSSAASEALLRDVAAHPGVSVLTHAVNRGKGRALKTAFDHALQQSPTNTPGVVTADADGQHLAGDIRRVAERLEQQGVDGPAVILGSRSFATQVPLANRLGNLVTRRLFRLLTGRALTDTQTGLRGIPRAFLPDLLALKGERYEFELEMLTQAVESRWPLEEIPIATVYGSFAKSHFQPFVDSLRIYRVFVRFALTRRGRER